MEFLNWRLTAIVGVALLLVFPAIVWPQMTHGDLWLHWVWLDQFKSELANGNPYPRWLPLSHGGLGSPVFYYYPPLAFYVGSVFGIAGFSTNASIIAAMFMGFLVSGIAMYAWLKESAKAPLFGALLFMAAPYHVFDYYSRGAFAECFAIALIPLVALGVRRAAEGRLVLGALAYAALISAHIPLALLVSLIFVGPYALYLGWQSPRQGVRIAVCLLLGIAVAAIYLVPALALDQFRDSAKYWHAPGLKPESWSLLTWVQPGPPPSLKLAIGAMILVLLQPILLLFMGGQRAWGAYAGLCCILVAGLVPGFWSLPLIETVQFPYRMLPLAEFAIATGVAHVALPRLVVYVATVPLFAVASTYFIFHPWGPAIPIEKLAQHPDVDVNLPPGGRPDLWISDWALALSNKYPRPKQVGDYTVDNVFYFPAWEVRCNGRQVVTAPEARTKLLTYKGVGCERRLSTTPPERVGALISLAGLLVVLVLGGLSRFGSRIRPWLRPRRRPPSSRLKQAELV